MRAKIQMISFVNTFKPQNKEQINSEYLGVSESFKLTNSFLAQRETSRL